jgi:hypothetical protein
MVGRAVCRELLEAHPARIVVSSLSEAESRKGIEMLREELARRTTLEARQRREVELVPEWGNIFVRTGLHLQPYSQVLADPEGRAAVIADIFEPLTDEVLERFYLYQLIVRHRPHIIVDAINTATAIAYSDVYSRARQVAAELKQTGEAARESVELLLCSSYIPSLIRHVEVLWRAINRAGTSAYVKIGTSGTGGMGWNIPYTHGEERPSALLLSKSAVAGAHTLLLFLMARTPAIETVETPHGALLHLHRRPPMIKEIKPTAAIAWKDIGYGEVLYKGRPILLQEVSFEDGVPLAEGQKLLLDDPSAARPGTEPLRSVYVDTGENGMFSTEEFIAITSPGQMGFVTPEEIARNVVDEVRGINTGKDVVSALNVTCMGPTYRAGFQRERAIRKLRELEARYGTSSVAFEILGPPRLSKLLYEAHLLQRRYKTMQAILATDAGQMAQDLVEELRGDPRLLATMLSVGIPVIYSRQGVPVLLRGRLIKTPPATSGKEVEVSSRRLEEWARAGWVDLRRENMERWRRRIRQIFEDVASIPPSEQSSRYVRDRDFWSGGADGKWELNPGEMVAWIFSTEDQGERGRE